MTPTLAAALGIEVPQPRLTYTGNITYGTRFPARCGTEGGYYRHRRVAHTDPCDSCIAAHAHAERLRARRRRNPRW